MERTVGLAALWVVALALQGLLSETFRGWHDIRSATLFGGLITGLLSAIVFSAIWVVRGHSDLSEVLAVSIVAGASSSVAAGILLKQKIMPLKGTDRIRPREVLEIAWPLLLTNVVYFGLNQGDLLILGAFRSSEEVALYGAAVQVVTLVSFPLIIVNAVVPPLIAELYARGEKSRLERTLRTTATAAGIPALVVAAALILFGGPILGVVYGNYYADGYFVVAALGLGYLINVLFGSCGNTLIMTGHHYTMLAITVLTGAVTIGGMFWVVGRYGMPAVAVVSSARIILQNFLMWIYAWKKTGVWTHANFRPSAIRGFLQTTE
jgi:O-antigen/teichoic acid export membrane protein